MLQSGLAESGLGIPRVERVHGGSPWHRTDSQIPPISSSLLRPVPAVLSPVRGGFGGESEAGNDRGWLHVL